MKDATVLCIKADSLKKYPLPVNTERKLIPVDQDQILDPSALVVYNRLIVDDLEQENHQIGCDNPQLLPYIIVSHQGKVLNYSREKGTEQRLRTKRSIGLGGHIDSAENHGVENYAGLIQLLVADAQREVLEEVGIHIQHVEFTHFIADKSDHVGKVHLGILGQVELTDEQFNAINPQEAEIVDLQWSTLDELKADYAIYESWSQMILEMLGNK